MGEKGTDVELRDFSEPSPPIPELKVTGPEAGHLNTVKIIKPDLYYIKGFSNAKETLQPAELVVTGELPTWLNGELFTVGPGIYDVKYNKMVELGNGQYESGTATFSMGHWFDGLPLLNRFILDGTNNKIIYRSRLIAKKQEEKIRDRHGIITTHPYSLFKTHANQTPLAKLMMKKRPTKPEQEPCSASIHVNFPLNVPGERPKIFCQNHSTQVVELDAHDLTPTRLWSWNDLNPSFQGVHAGPHSHYDATRGELINFNMEYHALGTKYNFFLISQKNQKGELIASVTAKSSYVHSFAVTPRFIILTLYPFYAKNAGLNVKWVDNIMDAFVFRPEEPSLFYVISRAKKQHVATYKSDSCFAFHHINAFEDDDDNIYIDIACYEDSAITNYLTLENFREGFLVDIPLAEIRRFVLTNIQLESIKFTNIPQATQREVLQSTVANLFRSRSNNTQSDTQSYPIANYSRCADSALELPRINPRYQRNRYRYVYGISFSAKAATNPGEIWDALIKCDLENKDVVAMWCSDFCYPSEPMFIPVPNIDSDEDDGVIISIIFNGKEEKSFLLVLEARELKEIARVDLPQVIPLSFGHGAYKETPKE